MRRLSCLVAVAMTLLSCVSGLAANTVLIESKTVAAGAAGVSIGVLLTNDVPLQIIVVPLEIRSVTNSAFITAMAMSFGARLDTVLTGGIFTTHLGSKAPGCRGNIPSFQDVLYTETDVKHPVLQSPEGALFARTKVQTRALSTGSDITPSLVLTVDVGMAVGTFEIDTTCTVQNNHLYFIGDAPIGQPFEAVVPVFTKGVITVTACNCAHHCDLNGDDIIDVLDSAFLIDYVFGGSPIPPADPGCPHVDRGDVNCDGGDDVFDVIHLNDYVFSAGPAPCDPCACSPYPTNCP